MERLTSRRRDDYIGSLIFRCGTVSHRPPGTGKTSTLLALLNSLYLRECVQLPSNTPQFTTRLIRLNDGTRGVCRFFSQAHAAHAGYARYKAYYEALLQRGEEAWRQAARMKPRILVSAPSNIAVDSIMQRSRRGRIDTGREGGIDTRREGT